MCEIIILTVAYIQFVLNFTNFLHTHFISLEDRNKPPGFMRILLLICYRNLLAGSVNSCFTFVQRLNILATETRYQEECTWSNSPRHKGTAAGDGPLINHLAILLELRPPRCRISGFYSERK